MKEWKTVIPLYRRQFAPETHRIASTPRYEVNGFTYPSGVEAVHVKTDKWELAWLPFLGQQIWQYHAGNEQISMNSPVTEPSYQASFLENYGGFLLHCGLSGMGNPGDEDSHPHHGELHAAVYQEAQLVLGYDQNAEEEYLDLTGAVQYRNSFGICYRFSPCIRTWPHRSWVSAECSIENLRERHMPFAYLAHINFLPSCSEVIYTTPWEKTDVRNNPPADAGAAASYETWYQEVSQTPEKLLRIEQSNIYDPEVVTWNSGSSSTTGVSCTMAVRKDGSAFWVSQDTAALNHGIRWFSINEDFQAAGILLPATAETEGFTKEKAKGNIHYIEPKGNRMLRYCFGLIDDQKTVNELLEFWNNETNLCRRAGKQGLVPREN